MPSAFSTLPRRCGLRRSTLTLDVLILPKLMCSETGRRTSTVLTSCKHATEDACLWLPARPCRPACLQTLPPHRCGMRIYCRIGERRHIRWSSSKLKAFAIVRWQAPHKYIRTQVPYFESVAGDVHHQLKRRWNARFLDNRSVQRSDSAAAYPLSRGGRKSCG